MGKKVVKFRKKKIIFVFNHFSTLVHKLNIVYIFCFPYMEIFYTIQK
jgi:hypothetical protein